MALVENDPRLEDGDAPAGAGDYSQFFDALDQGGLGTEFLGFEGQTQPEPVTRLARPRTDPEGEQFGSIEVPPTFTASDVNRLTTMPVAERARLKQRMIRAGMLDAKTTTGASTVDPEFLVGYEQLLTWMNLNGFRDEFDAISMIERAPETLPSGALPSEPLPASEDIAGAVRDAFVRKTGQEPDDDALTALTRAYEQRVRGVSDTERPPTVGAFAEGRIESEFPMEVAEQDFLNRGFEFLSLLDANPFGGQV